MIDIGTNIRSGFQAAEQAQHLMKFEVLMNHVDWNDVHAIRFETVHLLAPIQLYIKESLND